MFFTEKEKLIYTPKGSEVQYDPLVLDRMLIVISEGQIDDLLSSRNAYGRMEGDISKSSMQQQAIDAAKAELELARIARKVFNLPEFPDCLDAQALETLYDYLEWMEGKDKPGKPRLNLHESSLVS